MKCCQLPGFGDSSSSPSSFGAVPILLVIELWCHPIFDETRKKTLRFQMDRLRRRLGGVHWQESWWGRDRNMRIHVVSTRTSNIEGDQQGDLSSYGEKLFLWFSGNPAEGSWRLLQIVVISSKIQSKAWKRKLKRWIGQHEIWSSLFLYFPEASIQNVSFREIDHIDPVIINSTR